MRFDHNAVRLRRTSTVGRSNTWECSMVPRGVSGMLAGENARAYCTEDSTVFSMLCTLRHAHWERSLWLLGSNGVQSPMGADPMNHDPAGTDPASPGIPHPAAPVRHACALMVPIHRALRGTGPRNAASTTQRPLSDEVLFKLQTFNLQNLGRQVSYRRPQSA